MMIRHGLPILLSTALLAGCGTAGSPLAAHQVRSSAQALEADAAEPLIAGLKTAWEGLKGMTATSETTLYQHGKVLESKTVEIAFTAPKRRELTVTAGSGVGSHLTWDGGKTVHASLGWWGVDLPLNSPQLTGPYGWTLEDTGPGMVVRMLAAAGVKAQVKGAEKSYTVLDVVSPASPAKVTREELVVDPKRHYVVERRLFAGDELLGRITVKAYKPS